MKIPKGKVTVVVPVYNEENTILEVLKNIKKVLPTAQVIVVDDASTDSTAAILKKNKSLTSKIITHYYNGGKGAALRSGFKEATGEFVVIQDADLEYNPADIPTLLEPLLAGQADVVYGSRFKGHQAHRVVYFWNYLANLFLTFLTNAATNLNISDMETGYKAISRKFLKNITLSEKGFSIEPEITIKLARQKARFYEVGISYHGRTYQDGKKITPLDFFKAIRTIVHYTFF